MCSTPTMEPPSQTKAPVASVEPVEQGAMAESVESAFPVSTWVFDQGVPTEVVDSSVLTCGLDPAVAGDAPTELLTTGPGPSGDRGRCGNAGRRHPLATAPAGAELAALLEIFDPHTLADPDLVEFIAAGERVKAWADGRVLAGTQELTGRCARLRGVCAGADQVAPEQVAATEVAAALGVSPAAARARVELARSLRRLPLTRIALTGGRIDLTKARAIVEAVAVLGDQAAAAVEARVITRAPDQSLPNLKASLRRAVIAIDPAAAERRHQAALAERGVSTEALEHGMSQLDWVGPSDQVEASYQWITALALAAQTADREHARHTRDPGQHPAGRDPDSDPDSDPGQDPAGSVPDPFSVRTLNQARSDVLGDLAAHALTHHDLPRRHGRPPQIGVLVAASTLLGADDEPAELVGVGPITAPTARRIAAEGEWRRLLTDPAGQLTEISADTYTPPQAMRDLVITRDRTCQGPGCRMPATRCELDHTIPWPTGPTHPDNLHPLCKTHHRLKTLTDTGLVTDGNRGLIWTLPTGHTHHRPAQPLLDHPALTGQPPPSAPTGTPPATDPDPPPF